MAMRTATYCLPTLYWVAVNYLSVNCTFCMRLTTSPPSCAECHGNLGA